jgi:hypothetical protein
MPSAGFEPAIPATKRRQTYALDGAATGIDNWDYTVPKILSPTTKPGNVTLRCTDTSLGVKKRVNSVLDKFQLLTLHDLKCDSLISGEVILRCV